ncbi:hypothetical protein OAQ85_04280 [Schleiferiaceae bacterium]|nr:hypothetical protein [Schleiferiaceae bacterium]
MKRVNKEAIDVLSNKPIWFQSGFHAKTGETIDQQAFEKRIKALKCLSEGLTIGNLNKVQGRTILFNLGLSAGKVYKVHADSLVSALVELISQGQLQTAVSERGNKKLSNSPQVIPGVQIYLLP